VQFDQTHYLLTTKSHRLRFEQNGLDINLPLNKCQQKLVGEWETKFKLVRATYKDERLPTQSVNDVALLESGKTQKIGRGTRWGTFLRDIPSDIPYLFNKLKVACLNKE